MKRRIAVLDLGTNTFHLLIADMKGGRMEQKVAALTSAVKLGEGGITKGFITGAAFDRGLEAMRYFRSVIDEHGATEIYAAGTAALRSASNGADFIARVKQEAGISIQIIDGTREAELIYKGVRQGVALSDSALIMDIGGGSVEFIFCDQHEIFHKKSYPIGAARLMALFHKTDPISEADISAIHQHLDEQLADLKINAQIFKPGILIGSAGAFETFTQLILKKRGTNDTTEQTSFHFNPDQLDVVISEVLRSTHQERAENEAITPVRVDMIVVASVLTSYVIQELRIPAIAMSIYSLKEGLLFDRAGA